MPDIAGKKTAYYGFTGIIEPGSSTRIASALNSAVNDGYDEIYLCLSSPGGFTADGIYLYNHIRSLPIEVTIHNTGTVSSIATVVYVAASKRLCSEHGVFMVHPTAMSQEDNMRSEKLQDLLNAALADDQRTENILRERTSMPDDALSARRYRDVSIVPQQAVEFGLADAVCDFTLPRGNKIFQI